MSKSSSSRTRAKTRAKAKSSPKTKAKISTTFVATASEPAVTADSIERSTGVGSYLQRWNVWLAVIFIVEAAAILLLSNPHSFGVTTQYLANNPLMEGHVLVAASRRLFDLNIGYLVALLLLVSAAEYALVASLYRKQYESEIVRGINRLRWIQEAIVPSILFVTVALLVGIYDLSTLLMIAVLSTVLHLLASYIELKNAGKKTAHWAVGRTAALTGITPFIVLAVYTVSTSVYGSVHLPAYVYGVLGTLLLMFAVFTTNYILQRRGQGRWADYLFGERIYMIINIIAKSALAWQIFAGLLHP